MSKVMLAACLMVACSWASSAMAKDSTTLTLPKGARIGVVNMLDAEVTHFHTAKALAQSFLKTQPVGWQLDSMLGDAVTLRLTQLGFVVVPLGASDALAHNRDDFFVENSVAKGLCRECAKEFAQMAAAEHVDALIVLLPGLNNPAQAGPAARRALPEYLRGWGFVTSNEGPDKPALFNMTQMLLISTAPGGAVLQAREWGGGYADEWADYVPPANPKLVPPDELDQLQPLFARILGRQSAHLLDWVAVKP